MKDTNPLIAEDLSASRGLIFCDGPVVLIAHPHERRQAESISLNQLSWRD